MSKMSNKFEIGEWVDCHFQVQLNSHHDLFGKEAKMPAKMIVTGYTFSHDGYGGDPKWSYCLKKSEVATISYWVKEENIFKLI